MASDDAPESDNLVIRHLQKLREHIDGEFGVLREDMNNGFAGVDARLVKIEATLKTLVVDLQIANRVTALEVEVAKLKKAKR